MTAVSSEEFIVAAEEFVQISERLNDGWKLIKNETELHKSYIKKETFVQCESSESYPLLKTEYVIFYNLSYGVPSFSFNVWDSTGGLLPLEKIREMSFIDINEKDFYSVITQQEHPLFFRPYFMVHPCHTAEILSTFKTRTKNIIVTFLSLITPLIKLKVPLEYGLL